MALVAGGPSSVNPFMATGGPLSVAAGRLSFTFGFKVRAARCLLLESKMLCGGLCVFPLTFLSLSSRAILLPMTRPPASACSPITN